MRVLDCLIPVYNNESYLQECLESILLQTFQDFQVLVYDAASTDRSSYIIEGFQKKDPRITHIKAEKYQGNAESLNQLLKLSKAKYIAWQFPNDYSHPTRFEKQLHRLKNSSLVGLGTSIRWDGSLIDQKIEEVIASENPKEVLFQQIGSDSHRGLFLESTLYQRKALKGLFFDPSLPVKYDLEFNAGLQEKFPLRLANLKEPLYTIRVFPGCIHQQEFEGKVKVDETEILNRTLPALLYVNHHYIDNVRVSNGFVPY